MMLTEDISPVNIEDELKQSYLDYAMSVIVGRALPDVCDGLKPVHRRVLYSMYELGNEWNKAYKKSARVVGDVIGKYHPHGDGAVYGALVRMAQDFSMRHPLIDGQGNFGSIDGDPPAAMRYTEVRMAKMSLGLLADLDKDTVDFVPNYDESERQPVVFPAKFPNLLINGSSGIAVGMATNIPPHNLSEVIDGCLALIEDPNLSSEDLFKYIPGPDFPTAGMIIGRSGILEAYKTGKGRVYIRSKTSIEVDEKNSKQSIIVTELPYQVNKARLIEKIAELVRHKKIEGISGLRDESDKQGMRVVIELKRSENADVILNNLYSQTQLQTVFGINLVALVDNQPKLMGLSEILNHFLKHRRRVVSRRTQFELIKAQDRAHILAGLAIALYNIEPIIQLIKQAKSPVIAKQALLATAWDPNGIKNLLEVSDIPPTSLINPDEGMSFGGLATDGYYLSSAQAQAILDLRLHRLTGLEQEKIINEYQALMNDIMQYKLILADSGKLLEVIKNELLLIKSEFGCPRLTTITGDAQDFSYEDLIAEQEMVVTLSNDGYIKSQPLDSYRSQKRGGKGKSATIVKDQDFITKLFIANSHDTLLCFTSVGKVYWLKVHQIPMASRIAKGRPIINLLPLSEGEVLSAVCAVRQYSEGSSIFMATSSGTVKMTSLVDFSRPRSNGIIAIDLAPGDQLIGAEITDGAGDILLSTNAGKAIRFGCDDVRCMGRSARGVRGIKLKEDQKLISLCVLKSNTEGAILTATVNGFGKRTAISEYSKIGRGGQGVIAIQTTSRNGNVVGAVEVVPGDQIMLITNQGTLVRTRVDEISIVGRNTQGVRLINLADDEQLVAIYRATDLGEDIPGDVSDISDENA